MRVKPFLHAMGLLLIGEAVLMVPALIVALAYGEGDAAAFAYTIALLVAAGAPMAFLVRSRISALYMREGFVIVGISWIVLSLFGMLPFLFSNVIQSPVDAFFETVSGFTTTGASILTNVEGLPHGILFWRSFTNWVGGMGILVLTIALMPKLGLKNMELLRAESPGPSPEKLLPRIRQTARTLYLIYFGMSILLFVLLLGTGMKPFDSIVNTFSTAGTGGFSVLNQSIGGYGNATAETIIGIFMLLFGVNFTVYFALLMRQWKKALKSQELALYLCIVLVSVCIILTNTLPRFPNAAQALHHAFFQTSSIITTTGFSSVDFQQWPELSRCILLVLMVLGACAGSTGGGIKIARLLIAGKATRREMHYILHPRIVRMVTVDGKRMEETMLRSVLVFLFAYTVIIVAATIVVSIDGFDLVTNFSAVLSAIGNIGPGLNLVGPMGNFSAFSDLSKVVLTFCMLAGRLEIMPILLLFSQSMWRRM